MHDAVPDGLHVARASQWGRRAGLQVLKDAPDRVGMVCDGQFRADRVPARPSETQPGWLRAPVDRAVGKRALRFSLEETEFQRARAGVADQNLHELSLQGTAGTQAGPWASSFARARGNCVSRTYFSSLQVSA